MDFMLRFLGGNLLWIVPLVAIIIYIIIRVIINRIGGLGAIKTVFNEFLDGMGLILKLALATWQGILGLIAYYMPTLHVNLSVTPIPDGVKGGLLILVIAGVLCVLIAAAINFSTMSKWTIIVDLWASAFWSLAYIGLLGYQYGQHDILFWIMAPLCFTLLELALSTFAGIQNAWNKNPSQLERAVLKAA